MIGSTVSHYEILEEIGRGEADTNVGADDEVEVLAAIAGG